MTNVITDIKPLRVFKERALIYVVNYSDWDRTHGFAICDSHKRIIGRIQSADFSVALHSDDDVSGTLKLTQAKASFGMAHLEHLEFTSFALRTLPMDSHLDETLAIQWETFTQYIDYEQFRAVLYSGDTQRLFDDYIFTALSFIDPDSWSMRVNPNGKQFEEDADQFCIYLRRDFQNPSPYPDNDVLNYFKLSPSFTRLQSTLIDDVEHWVLSFVDYRPSLENLEIKGASHV